jgi:ABC-type Mn2+/Zn2+ transport system permease subunit
VGSVLVPALLIPPGTIALQLLRELKASSCSAAPRGLIGAIAGFIILA